MKAQLWPNCTNTRLSLSNRLSLFSAHAPTTHLIDCLYLPSACMLYHLHTGTSFNLSPLSRTSPLPTSSRDPFLFPTRRGVIYPKDELWKNNLCLPSPACSSLFGDLRIFRGCVSRLSSDVPSAGQGYPASPGRPAIIQHCLWPCEQQPTYFLGCFGRICQSSLLSLIKLIFFFSISHASDLFGTSTCIASRVIYWVFYNSQNFVKSFTQLVSFNLLSKPMR